MRFRLSILALAALAASACETAEGYRQRMDLLTGASADALLVDWGPPQSRTPMSDGRELWSYNKVTINRSDGYWRDESREVKREFIDKDGKKKSEIITETFPVWEPPHEHRSACTTRFVMAGGRVENVAFDGEGCVAEEISR